MHLRAIECEVLGIYTYKYANRSYIYIELGYFNFSYNKALEVDTLLLY